MAGRYPDPSMDEFGAGLGYARLRPLPAALEHARALEQVARLALVHVDLGEAAASSPASEVASRSALRTARLASMRLAGSGVSKSLVMLLTVGADGQPILSRALPRVGGG